MGTAGFEVGENGFDHGRPVEEQRCVVRGAWCVIGTDGEFVAVSGGLGILQSELQFHGGLAFEADLLAQAGERGDSVKEAPDAGGQRRIEAAR